jgi:hypothetical protein
MISRSLELNARVENLETKTGPGKEKSQMLKYKDMNGHEIIMAMLKDGTFRHSGVEKDLQMMMDKFNSIGMQDLLHPVMEEGDRYEKAQSQLTKTEQHVLRFVMDAASLMGILREKYYHRVVCMICDYMRAVMKAV